MRFKFRAWDKEKNVMMPVKLMDWSEWWISCNPIGVNEPLAFGERNSFNNEQTDRHIIMQYTGIKDKNGKEIYEEDLLKNEFGRIVRVIWFDAGNQGQWDKIAVNDVGHVHRYDSWDRWEIIGNIYENPELL